MRERIKILRKALKLTQEKFAERLSLSPGYIAELELGRKKINDRIVKLICLTFNARTEWVYTGEGDMFAAPVEATPSPYYEDRIYKNFKKLNPEFQSFIANKIYELLMIQESRPE